MKLERFLRAAMSVLAPLRRSGRSTTGREPSAPLRPRPRSSGAGASAPGKIGPYDARRSGPPSLSYAPTPDGDPDPGEVVWGWVPYEEDASQGKDRPVLIIGTAGRDLVGLQLTSKDHSRDHDRETSHGRIWLDVGSGAWDSRGRESEARIDRVLAVPAGSVRREGATLPRGRFDDVVAAVSAHHGW